MSMGEVLFCVTGWKIVGLIAGMIIGMWILPWGRT